MDTISEAMENIFKIVTIIKEARSEESAGGEKITLSEKIKIAIQGISLYKLVASFSKLKSDWQNRTEESKKEWSDLFAEKFDIPNDEIELIIEEVVTAMINFENVLGKIGVKNG